MDTHSFRHSLKIPIAKITDYDWISGIFYPTFLMAIDLILFQRLPFKSPVTNTNSRQTMFKTAENFPGYRT
jgi:hypothetical protein